MAVPPPLSGCFAAVLGRRGGPARRSKHLRMRRREVVERARHGDTPALSAWLAAGLDPALRDGRGRTLLHLLSWLPAPLPLLRSLVAAGLDLPAPLPLLRSLVAAGLDLPARDERGLTPLLHAIAEAGTPELISALLALGASPSGSRASISVVPPG